MATTFGKTGGGDIAPFQLAIVQFGTRSMSSTAVESGNMLDIKTMHSLSECTIDAPRIIPLGLLSKTVSDTTSRREGFLSGAEVSEERREHCSMSMIRCALATSFFPLDLGLLSPNSGAFAVAPDGSIRFHATVPIGDIPPTIFAVKFDPRIHGTTDAAWMCRLFNVSMKFGAVRLVVTYDAYRNKNVQPEDQTAQGYAHVDVLRLIEGIHSVQPVALSDTTDTAILSIVNARAPNAANSVQLFAECAPGIDVAIDARPLTHQTAHPPAMSTVAHASDASWSLANLVSVYHNKALVLAFVVPTGGETSPTVARGGAALTPIEMPDLAECFVQSDDPPASSQLPAADLPTDLEETRGKKKPRHS